MGFDRRLERREILSLAVATGNENGGASEAFQRSFSRRNRRRLGIVDKQNAAHFADAFHAMRQASELRERMKHSSVDLGERRRQRQRRQRIERVVSTNQAEIAGREQRLVSAREPARPL